MSNLARADAAIEQAHKEFCAECESSITLRTIDQMPTPSDYPYLRQWMTKDDVDEGLPPKPDWYEYEPDEPDPFHGWEIMAVFIFLVLLIFIFKSQGWMS